MSQSTFRFPRVNRQETVQVTSDSDGTELVVTLRADLTGQLPNYTAADGVTTLYLQSETGTTEITGNELGDGSEAAPGSGTSVASSLPAPDWNFDDGGAWVNVWDVYWPGGPCTFTHDVLGVALPTSGSCYIDLVERPMTNVTQYDAGFTPLAESLYASGVWSDPTSGEEVPEGIYALALYVQDATGRPYTAPVLPAGMLYAPTAAA